MNDCSVQMCKKKRTPNSRLQIAFVSSVFTSARAQIMRLQKRKCKIIFNYQESNQLFAHTVGKRCTQWMERTMQTQYTEIIHKSLTQFCERIAFFWWCINIEHISSRAHELLLFLLLLFFSPIINFCAQSNAENVYSFKTHQNIIKSHLIFIVSFFVFVFPYAFFSISFFRTHFVCFIRKFLVSTHAYRNQAVSRIGVLRFLPSKQWKFTYFNQFIEYIYF